MLNCFSTRSFGAEKNKKNVIKLAKFKIYANHLDNPHAPPPLGRGKGDSPRWSKCQD